MTEVLLATPNADLDLVSSAAACGVRVVRRCVDAVDLLAASALGPAVCVVVSADLPRLSAEVVARLGSIRCVVGVAADPLDAAELEAVGVQHIVPLTSPASATWEAVLDAVGTGEPGSEHELPAGLAEVAEPGPAHRGAPSPLGALVAVWGPMGAPGRTTVAIGLAEALAESGRRVCLVDADTYAPSIALALGIVGDSGGLLRICRQADSGLLTGSTARSATRLLRGSWHVLTGLPAVERWPELTSVSLGRVWDCLIEAFDVTVVDIGFCVEGDDSPPAWARGRNLAAGSALARADHVVAVADSAGHGAARLLSAWPALVASAPGVPTTIVRNRARRGDRSREWEEALRAFGLDAPAHPMPQDARALATCWPRGRTLGEGARRSSLRKALARLGGAVVGG